MKKVGMDPKQAIDEYTSVRAGLDSSLNKSVGYVDELMQASLNAVHSYVEGMTEADAELVEQQKKNLESIAKLREILTESAVSKELQYHANLVEAEKEFLEWQKAERDKLNSREVEIRKNVAIKVYQAEQNLRKKNKDGKLTKADKDRLDALKKYEEQLERKKDEAAAKRRKQQRKKEIDAAGEELATGLLKGNFFNSISEFKTQLAEKGANKAETAQATLKMLASLSQQLENNADKIASRKSAIDTRLYGSGNRQSLGSYWDAIEQDYQYKIGAVGFFKQEALADTLQSYVEKGISHNVEQRAFLATIKDKIATTFNATDGTLLRLVRIQQQDTTANRLGMEAALNAFLNNMYETTEYMTDIAAGVRASLEEMESLMAGAQATEIEYQVQKWMGSMYSVGMSQNAVSGIAQAFGQLAAGDVTAITNGGNGNLMVMAANEAGISISDILAKGLDAEGTNRLMQAMVNYLAEIAESSADSRVVQQQLANVYGLKASDLKAITNLADTSTKNSIFNNRLTHKGMMDNLNRMADSMIWRTSMQELISNTWENTLYAMAGTMANNPIMYGIQKAAGLLDSVAGGIPITFVEAMGTGFDLNTSVADLMRTANMAGMALGGLGSFVSGLTSTGSGSFMLKKMGITGDGTSAVTRGNGTVAHATGGADTSFSGMVSNGNSDDILGATYADADEQGQNAMVKALEQESLDTTNATIDAHILQIYDLLRDIASDGAFKVKLTSTDGSIVPVDIASLGSGSSTGAGYMGKQQV